LNPGQSTIQAVDTAPLGPGTYWFEFRYYDTLMVLRNEYFCFEIRSTLESAPLLTPQTPAQQGTNLVLSLNDTTSPGQLYVVAASFTSNTGIPVPGFASPLCLDPDALFNLSYPAPLPGLFTNFTGALDGTGLTTGITISIPVAPVLNFRGLHIQAVVLGGAAPRISNGLSFTILP
jgi:hypothetical protein